MLLIMAMSLIIDVIKHLNNIIRFRTKFVPKCDKLTSPLNMVLDKSIVFKYMRTKF